MVVGVVVSDVLLKNMIFGVLQEKGIEVLTINSARFNVEMFDKIIVDLKSSNGFLALGACPDKCLAFIESSQKQIIEKAKSMGCRNVFGFAKFFKEILPEIGVGV